MSMLNNVMATGLIFGGLIFGGLIFGWACIRGGRWAYIWIEVSVSICGGLIFGGLIFGGAYSRRFTV